MLQRTRIEGPRPEVTAGLGTGQLCEPRGSKPPLPPQEVGTRLPALRVMGRCRGQGSGSALGCRERPCCQPELGGGLGLAHGVSPMGARLSHLRSAGKAATKAQGT